MCDGCSLHFLPVFHDCYQRYFASDRGATATASDATRQEADDAALASLQRVTSVWWDPETEKQRQATLIERQRQAVAAAAKAARSVAVAAASAATSAAGDSDDDGGGGGGGDIIKPGDENPVANEDNDDPKYAAIINQIQRGEFAATSFYPYTTG